ncbi:DNA sulfur modification protein DndB [Micromonospora sp. NPDC048935]|uniref:DNA sulfur modification protein DndB n=1 Tax=Micromonospora sp. NPDC048935 TaxID=3364262 RepID=UPI00371A958F
MSTLAQRRPSPVAERRGAFEYVFPAIRGVQAQREFYVTMCPLRLIPRLFVFDEEELLPELRAQRTLNRARVPDIARYILENQDTYTFSALTASVDADLRFEGFEGDGPLDRIGTLSIPMSAKFVINDGQHRRAAIEEALRENPELGDESIAVVLFLDLGLSRCQQMFADLNRYAIRPAPSLSVLYDQRDTRACIARQVVFESRVLTDLVETEKSNLSVRSRKLFTLSAVFTCTKALLDGFDDLPYEKQAGIAQDFWTALIDYFPDWKRVAQQEVTAGDIRRDFLHSHGIALHALGKVGNRYVSPTSSPQVWRKKLAPLREVDWSRANRAMWEGRALVGGRISKSSANVLLTTNALRGVLGQELNAEEQLAEKAFMGEGR